MKKTLPLLLALTSTSLFAGFDFNTCSGAGTFEQEIVHYGGNYENAATVGEIPQGIQGLKINLISNRDVDIRLYGENEDKIVHWPRGILNGAVLETKPYQDVNVTYSGYNGTGGQRGHEFIEVEGTTPTAFTMKAFGYIAGHATVNYSWTGKEGCTPTTSGTGTFEQTILNKATNLVGTIPPNVENVEINLTSDNDLDIQLYAQDGTAIARWRPAGLMSGPRQQSVIYHDMNITWSGYNGVNNQKGHEYITIECNTTEMLTMKVYGYQAGVADVVYKWGENLNPVNIGNWTRTNPGAGGTINMIGATASGVLVTASDLSGVYISLDKNGAKWDALGEKNGLMLTSHMSALGFHPTDGNTFYVGTGRGVYKTANLGTTFSFISENMTYDNSLYDNSSSTDTSDDDTNTYVESIVVSKSQPQTLYVTYHKWDDNEPSCIAKSTNGGRTWTDVTFPPALRPNNLRIVKLVVHPTDANLIYAIAGKPRWGCSAPKAYRSSDGGTTWSDISHEHDVLDLDIDYRNKNILYMSTFKTKRCNENPTFENYVSYDDNGKVVNGNLYKSTNQGNDFGSAILNQTGIISVGTGDTNTGHDNSDSTIRLVNVLTFSSAYWMDDNKSGTWKSSDSGDTWEHHGTVSDWRPHIGYGNNPYTAYTNAFNGWNKTLTKDIFNSDRLYGAGGWTLGTFDGGRTFKSLSTKKVDETEDTWLSTGLENINGFALDVNDHDENIIYMGGYDIGFWTSKDRGLSWKWQNPFKDDLVAQNRYTWGATESEPESWEPDTLKTIGGSNVMTLLSDPTRPNVVWSSFARSQVLAEAEADASDSSKNDRSGLFRSTDYGETWTLSVIYEKNGDILTPYRHTVIYGLSIDKYSPNGRRVLYVTIDGNLAKSTDDGRTWYIIQEDGGLKFTAASAGVVYAGGKSGLWRLENGTWSRMGGALSNEMKGIGYPMVVDLSPQSNITHYDSNWNEIIDKYAWNGVHDIKIDPNNADIVYVVVYGQDEDNKTKGLYKTTTGGNSWSRVNLGVFENRYLRSVTIDPTDSKTLFVTSSQNINSGGEGGSSTGIFYSTNGGASWQDANANMAWKYGSSIEVDKLGKRVWAWSPGTGIQHMDIRP